MAPIFIQCASNKGKYNVYRGYLLFYTIQYMGIFLFTKQAVKMQKPNIFENTNNFRTTLFLTF